MGDLEPSRQRTTLAKRIGVVFGQRTSLWWDLPLRDSFTLLHKIYRTDPARHRVNLAEFLELLDLGDLLDTPVRQLSLGQRMRGDIAAALLHDPDILYLDEPTIGLDVVSKGRLREFLRALNTSRGVTLLLTTHDLQDIEALCDRVMVIDHGTLVYDGSLSGLHTRGEAMRTLVVDLVDTRPAIEVPGATVLRVDGPRQWLAFPAEASAAPIVAAVAAAYDVADLSIQEPDIEQVIRQLYSGARLRISSARSSSPRGTWRMIRRAAPSTPLPSARRSRVLEPGDAVLDVSPAGLDDAVGVEHQRLTRREHALAGLDLGMWLDAEREPARVVDAPRLGGLAPAQRGRVTGAEDRVAARLAGRR